MAVIRQVQRMLAMRALLGDALIHEPGEASPIEGVLLKPLQVNRDPRGTLTELLRSDWNDVYDDAMSFAQTYVSVTQPGIARDEDRWHVHERQTDRFVVIAGTIVVAIADARPDSPTRGKLVLALMQAADDAPAGYMLTVPPRTLHGLMAVGDTPAMLQNFPTRLWDASDEGRVSFEEAGVSLPDGRLFSWDLLREAWPTTI